MRNKHVFLWLIMWGVFSLLLSGCQKNRHANSGQPNVVIILADDLGYGDISCLAKTDYQTPNIDHLADEGILCKEFYVPTPYCAPSRETILTGRFPLRHGLIQNPTPDAGIDDIGIADSEVTLGEIFQQAGYRTKLIGKWHLGHKKEYFPVNHGFDEYYGILYSNDMRPVQIVENRDTVEYPVDQRLLTKKYTKKAIDFIEENQNKPFFLHLCHAMPHKPLAASEEFYTPDTPNDLYSDVIRELDWSVGEVVKKLKELKLLDNTILIFMSDNGPWYGGSTGGLKGMKATTWEGGLRVPFIIRYPQKLNSGSKINDPCWSPDIFPTILDLANIEIPSDIVLDGENITNLLNELTKEHKAIFGMVSDQITCIRKGNYKLFVEKPRFKRLPPDWVDPRGPDGITILAPMEQATPDQYPGIVPEEALSKIQLFHIVNDSCESMDLSEKLPEVVEKLMDDYLQFKSSLGQNI